MSPRLAWTQVRSEAAGRPVHPRGRRWWPVHQACRNAVGMLQLACKPVCDRGGCTRLHRCIRLPPGCAPPRRAAHSCRRAARAVGRHPRRNGGGQDRAADQPQVQAGGAVGRACGRSWWAGRASAGIARLVAANSLAAWCVKAFCSRPPDPGRGIRSVHNRTTIAQTGLRRAPRQLAATAAPGQTAAAHLADPSRRCCTRPPTHPPPTAPCPLLQHGGVRGRVQPSGDHGSGPPACAGQRAAPQAAPRPGVRGGLSGRAGGRAFGQWGGQMLRGQAGCLPHQCKCRWRSGKTAGPGGAGQRVGGGGQCLGGGAGGSSHGVACRPSPSPCLCCSQVFSGDARGPRLCCCSRGAGAQLLPGRPQPPAALAGGRRRRGCGGAGRRQGGRHARRRRRRPGGRSGGGGPPELFDPPGRRRRACAVCRAGAGQVGGARGCRLRCRGCRRGGRRLLENAVACGVRRGPPTAQRLKVWTGQRRVWRAGGCGGAMHASRKWPTRRHPLLAGRPRRASRNTR